MRKAKSKPGPGKETQDTPAFLDMNSETAYRSLFENMLNGFAYCRMLYKNGQPDDFIYLSVNKAFENQTGLKDVVGKKVSEVIPGIRESDPRLFEIYGRVARTGIPERFEIHLVTMKMWFDVSVYSPGKDHFVSVFEVITERKMAEERLRQAQKMEAVGRLAGGIAHDFNNLLTVILGQGEMAFMELKPGDPLLPYLKDIAIAAQRAASLTRQLLAFSRKQILHPGVLDLNVTVRNLERMLVRLIGEDIRMETELAEDLGMVKVDPGQIEQVVMNLAVNACDAMPQGGCITITTRNVSAEDVAALELRDTRPGPCVCLSIEDTGSGLDAQVMEHLFEPFFTTKAPGRGTGLGLSTVYGIVKQSGGDIRVSSQKGKGTVFSVYLPRIESERTCPEPVAVQRTFTGHGERILLVEDELVLREMLAKALRRTGFVVTSVANGGEALLAVEEGGLSPDLLVTDILMPGMSGKVLTTRLLRGKPGLKVLYISGYTDDIIAQHRILENGAALIQKPFTPGALVDKIASLLAP